MNSVVDNQPLTKALCPLTGRYGMLLYTFWQSSLPRELVLLVVFGGLFGGRPARSATALQAGSGDPAFRAPRSRR